MAVDLDIDRDAIEIDALVLRILALRQPVADDLRLLTASMKVVRDLERIGDEAVNIAERVAENAGGETSLVRAELEVLAEEARLMLESALKAFVDGDVERAHGVLLSDDAVDRRYSAIVVGMGNHMAERAVNVARGLLVVRVAKYLERIADHATNVAESVIFISRGEDVRHRQLAPAL
jgi:phosphate transport system protein